MQTENYYEEEQNDSGQPQNKKVIVGAIVVIAVIIILVGFLLVNSKDPNRLNITNPDQGDITHTGSLTLNGELIDTFSNEGRVLTHTSNPSETREITMNLNNTGIKFDKARVIVTDSSGQIVANIPPEHIIINNDGTVSFDLSYNDIGIDPDLIRDNGGEFEFNFQIIASNEDGTDVLTIEVPYVVQFEEFIGTGCLLLSRGAVTESTHFGQLKVPIKIKVTCGGGSLESRVDWPDKITGNAEIIFANGSGELLVHNDLIVRENMTPGVYDATIYYTPNGNEKGKKVKFSMNFKLGNSEKTIAFNILNENLEQCVKVTTIDGIIEDQGDSAKIDIDTSKCNSNVSISICETDPGCSGGADAGTIDLSKSFFVLTKSSPKKTITIKRNEIPGIYGVNVYASVPGINKVFIAEKEILVKPTREIFSLDKYAVSLMGSNSKDSIRVKHSELSEDLEIDAGVCEVYKNSSGSAPGSSTIMAATSNEESWAHDLYNNTERYAGNGFYQRAFGLTLPYVNSIRQTAQLKSSLSNSQIKLAYQAVHASDPLFTALVAQGNASTTTGNDLDDAMDDLVDIGDGDIAINIATLGTTFVSLIAKTTANCSWIETIKTGELTTLDGLMNALTKTCSESAKQPWKATKESIDQSLGNAETLCERKLLVLLDIYDAFNALKSAYDLIEQSTSDTQEADVGSSLTNIALANAQIADAKEYSDEAIYYIDLALQEISIDSFSEASSDTSKASEYLALALAQNNLAKSKMQAASRTALAAGEDLTSSIPDEMEEWEEVNAMIAAVAGLIKTLATTLIQSTTISGNLTAVQTSLTTNGTTLATALASCGTANCIKDCIGNGCDSCAEAAKVVLAEEANAAMIASVGTAQTSQSTIYAYITTAASTLSTLNQALTLYNSSIQDDITDAYTDASANTDLTLSMSNSLIITLNRNTTYLTNAITAANNLSNWENQPSSLADYTKEFNLPDEFGEYNKKRLNGLISSFVLAGFVSGAYDGGVYTTTNTSNIATTKAQQTQNKLQFATLQEKCSNRVKLKLPDYKINLLQDGGVIESSNTNVIPNWSFINSKVHGVFESQEVSINISNAGLRENTYTTLTINATKHEHDTLTLVENEFGPFNIPDAEVIDISEKFHIKLNVKPRTDYSSSIDATCDTGLLIGNTTKTALPKIILDWDWNAITSETAKGNYLDATQLSILLSKKLSVLNEFLRNSQTECPQNYAFGALQKMTHTDFEFNQTPSCFLPLTTKSYDDKPAIYYYMSQSPYTPEYYDDFFDEPLISNAEEMLEILDFEVLLMQDGYGLELQKDFAKYYSDTFLEASPAFTDGRNGMYNYFKNSKKFHFTNETHKFRQNQDFVIPDTGLYRIKIIADFSRLPLIDNQNPNAKIYIDMQLIEPINEKFSPFYYTPFDGKVGTKLKNDRRYYGTSSTNKEIMIAKSGSIRLDTEQRDSLKKLNIKTANDIFKTNSFASNRSKVLDFGTENVIMSPTIATPLLFELGAKAGEKSSLIYWITKNEKAIPSIRENLFLLTALEKCEDFFGNLMLDYINNTPDIKLGLNYGFGFPDAEKDGKTFVKTIAYAPVEDDYSLVYPTNALISTTNTIENAGLIPFEGITGMPANDLANNDYLTSIKAIFNSVENESICVSRSGDREFYFWSEQYLFEQENSEGKKLLDKIHEAKANCIK
jgi:hypothetical protein